MRASDTKQPHPIIELAQRVLAPTYRRPETLFVQGGGSYLQDEQDNKYLDMTSGVAVNALGYRSPVIIEALRKQLDGLIHTSNLFHTAPAVLLAEALVQHSFADKVFFANSGAESVEGAIKFARLHGGETRKEIVYFDGSFHGRTLGALSATDREQIRTPFAPLPEGYVCASWNHDSAFDAITEQTAAVIVEPIQGEGGIRSARKVWLQQLRKRCDEQGALLIFDEIQCGLGRTGRLWAHEHYAVSPDMMTLAKPLAGGLPMGAVLMSNRVAETITPGCHATTFGGGPLVASVALAVFQEVSSPVFLEEVQQKGRFLFHALQSIQSPHIKDVVGCGLFLGVHVNIEPSQVCEMARQEKLLLVSAGERVVRFLPPLNATQDALEDAVLRFEQALKRLPSTV